MRWWHCHSHNKRSNNLCSLKYSLKIFFLTTTQVLWNCCNLCFWHSIWISWAEGLCFAKEEISLYLRVGKNDACPGHIFYGEFGFSTFPCYSPYCSWQMISFQRFDWNENSMPRVTAVVCLPVNASLGQVAGNNSCQVLQKQLHWSTQIHLDFSFFLTSSAHCCQCWHRVSGTQKSPLELQRKALHFALRKWSQGHQVNTDRNEVDQV